MPGAGPVQIHATSDGNCIYVRPEGATAWTALPCDTASINITYAPDVETLGVGEDMAIYMPTTNSYTIRADQWVWHADNITYTTTATANQWAWNANAWGATTTGTGDPRWGHTIKAWEEVYLNNRVQRTQNDLQRATQAARVAGQALREWSIAEWAEATDTDLEDFTDEQSGLVIETYQHHWALAEDVRRTREAEAARVAEAERKAEHLLTSLLSAEQKRDWLENRGVTEVAPSGRIWRLIPQWSGGQMLMDPERPTVRRVTLCVHPTGQMPNVDSMVAVLLALRNGDEDMLLGLANVHSGSLNAEERQIKADWQAQRYAARTQNAEAARAARAQAAAVIEVA